MRHDAHAHFWCRTPTHGVRPLAPRTRHQRGNTYVIALLILVVLGLSASMLGWSALVQTRQAQIKETQMRLDSLLASGVTYARWARCYQNRNLPFTFTLNLSEGRVTGRVSANNRYGKNALQVQVTATYKDQSKTLTRIVDGARKARSTTEFALFLDEELVVDSGKRLVLKGDLHANNYIRVQPGGTLMVDGAASSSRQIIGPVTTTLYREPWSQVVSSDLVDLSDLRTRATHFILGNLNLPFGMTLPDKSVYYVQGNLQLRGTLRGNAIVAVEGNLEFTGDTDYADSDSLYVFFVDGNIVVPDGRRIAGLLISLDGNVQLGNGARVKGGIIILDGDLQLQGDATLEHDPRVNADLFRELTGLQDNGIKPLVPIPFLWGP
jgi:type II secretory pathway pseudopilin PulG